jgi:hypothetical protein
MTDAEIDADALAVDSLPDDLRTGVDTQDETSIAQLSTGDIALVGDEPGAGGSAANSATVFTGIAPEAHGDTTVTARNANAVMDPPGPPA